MPLFFVFHGFSRVGKGIGVPVDAWVAAALEVGLAAAGWVPGGIWMMGIFRRG